MKFDLDTLRTKHGRHATWAIWDERMNPQKKSLLELIEDNKEHLHTRYVLIGLNASAERSDWGSFHNGKHDRKLMYAFNDSAKTRGCYMTDLFRVIQKKSLLLKEELGSKSKDEMQEYVTRFEEEMSDIGITGDTKFIIFGRMAQEYYDNYFECCFPEIEVIKCKHYSARGTDEAWVEGVWEKLSIDGKFEEIIKKYRSGT